jgi:hypothetical protein
LLTTNSAENAGPTPAHPLQNARLADRLMAAECHSEHAAWAFHRAKSPLDDAPAPQARQLTKPAMFRLKALARQ